MDLLEGYVACINERKDEVTRAVFDGLIELQDTGRRFVARDVLAVARVALQVDQFNLYRPADAEAWEAVAHPIRVAADFEFVRLHLLSLVYAELAAYEAAEYILLQEAGLLPKLAVC